MEAITVYVCESQPIVIEGLARALEGVEDLLLMGASQSINEALDSIADLKPNIILFDQTVGNKAAFELIPKIRLRSVHSHTILWVTTVTEVESFRALQSGVRGILKKTLPISSIIECLRAVGKGNIWIENISNNEARYILALKAGLLAFASDAPPIVAVEFARRAIFSDVRPSFKEMEDTFRNKK